MSTYTYKNNQISGTYENKKQLKIVSKLYHHKTNTGFWSYIDGELVLTPFDKEVLNVEKNYN